MSGSLLLMPPLGLFSFCLFGPVAMCFKKTRSQCGTLAGLEITSAWGVVGLQTGSVHFIFWLLNEDLFFLKKKRFIFLCMCMCVCM